jgi:hypothetical protein
MNMTAIKQHAWAIGILLIIAILFCFPIFQGNVLKSHDFMSWQFMSQEAKVWYEAHGGAIYWSNNMFGGMPTYTHFGGSGYGNMIGTFLFNAINFPPRPLGLLLLCFICFYVLGTSLGWNVKARIIGSFAFGLSTYIPVLFNAGHDTKVIAIAFVASMLGGLIHMINNRKWLGLSIYTLSMCFLFCSSHLQIVYYTLLLLIVIAVVLVVDAIKKNTLFNLLKKVPIILVATLVSLLPTLSSNLLTKEYSKSTIRGGQSELTARSGNKKPTGGLDKDYAFSWSNGIGETFSLLIPRLYGGGSSENYQGGESYKYVESRAGEEQAVGFAENLPLYWGPQPFLSGPIYFGAVIVFLFIFSLFVIRSEHKWWIAITSLFFILLSLGKNFSVFNYFLFDHMPMYNKFRTPSMALSIPMVLFPMLGIWALNDLFENKINKEIAIKYLKISAGITAGLAFLVGVCSAMFFDFKGAGDSELLQQLGGEQARGLLDAIVSDRSSVAMKDGLRSLALIAGTSIVIWTFLKEKMNATKSFLLVGMFCFIDLFFVARAYVNEKSFEEKEDMEANFSPRPVDQQILQDKDPYYRVQDFTVNSYNDAKPSYFHKMIGGYHPAKIEIYQDLIEMQMTPGSVHNNKEVYNMLNTKYFIVPAGDKGQAQVVPNTEACGNAWFVNEIKFAPTADVEMASLNAPNLFDTSKVNGNFNPRQTAIVRENFKTLVSKNSFIKDSSSSIKLIQYGLNDLTFESNNTNDGFGVFSDVYYDGGWKAYIDGATSPIVRTNYVLRGLMIPAGKHKIEFKMFPTILKMSKPISMLGSLFVLLLFIFGLFKHFSEEKNRKIVQL